MIRILTVADLHLGRNPTRYANAAVETISTTAMWERIVDFAISEKVDALAMAGDIVNANKAFFSMLTPLERGLKRLEAANVVVYAVAGNHDVDLLARLANVLDSDAFVILGQDGRWESRTLVTDAGCELDVWGKSFTSERSAESPILSFPRNERRPGVPNLGILHCDLGGSGNYAPVRESELLGSGISTWVLGHIHAPTELPEGVIDTLAFYTGSPLPLDPTETGVHGPCMIQVGATGTIDSVTRVPISPLRYDTVTVDLNEANELEAVQELIALTLRRHADDALITSPELTHLAVRLRLVGKSRLTESQVLTMIHTHLQDGDVTESIHGRVAIYVEKATASLSPPIDFGDYRKQTDPMGVVAGLLDELGCGDALPDELSEIIDELTCDIARWNDRDCFGLTPNDLPDTDAVQAIAHDQVLKIAHAMYDQMASDS